MKDDRRSGPMTLSMWEIWGSAGESIDGSDLGEVGLTAQLKGQIPHLLQLLGQKVDVAILSSVWKPRAIRLEDVYVDAERPATSPSLCPARHELTMSAIAANASAPCFWCQMNLVHDHHYGPKWALPEGMKPLHDSECSCSFHEREDRVVISVTER